MNRVGIHYAYWTQDWNTDFSASIRKAASLGFRAMDFATEDMMALPREKKRDLRKLAEELDVALAFAPATGPDVDIASADPKVRAHGIDYFRRNVEFVAEMGSNILGGIVYSGWQVPFGGSMEEKAAARERSIESLAHILPTAEECGVLYCLEVVNRFEQYLLNTAAEGMAFLERLDSPNARLHLDTFHMNIEEDDMGAAIRLAGQKIGHFHIGECNRRVPGSGSGRMPWKQIFDALQDVGYQGMITMEPFVKAGGEVGKAIALWRDLVDGSEAVLDRDAAAACRFVEEMLRERK